MKPIIKKPEFRALKKSVVPQPVTEVPLVPEQLPPVEPAVADVPIEQQPLPEAETPTTEYPAYQASAQNYPVLQSVGNTGWQVSDIWRDLRVDGFCD
ncbi:hypothetical protein H6G94_33310 [Nostoc punctiforme FACHB-252]|uniref:Uncharacterized protein n=1 Tax=Nostoc punctiforme FACHB-252 TaxID=1357509 RepID=A0ABR8HL31_NOSPU|nr:hypothetical protein [Nostoc punctiforme]MBD2616066.1 hypothetical protein [Nostoc punctiforme FACHB-252]